MKEYEGVYLMNDAVAKLVFGGPEGREALSDLISIIIEKDIIVTESIPQEKSKNGKPLRNIRFDIKAKDKNGTCFDIEMQIRSDAHLERRAGLYLSQLQVMTTKETQHPSAFKDTIVIFICLRGLGHTKEASWHACMRYDDGREADVGHHIYFFFVKNAKKSKNAKKKTLAHDLDYIHPDMIGTQSIKERVSCIYEEVKGTMTWTEIQRAKYERIGEMRGIEQGREMGIEQGREMGIEQGREMGIEQGREMGIEQGRIEAFAEVAKSLIASGKTLEQVAKQFRWDEKTKEAVKAIIEAN